MELSHCYLKNEKTVTERERMKCINPFKDRAEPKRSYYNKYRSIDIDINTCQSYIYTEIFVKFYLVKLYKRIIITTRIHKKQNIIK